VIVLDASALVELLLRSDRGRRIQRVLQEPAQTVHAPHHVDLEVASALRRLTQDALLAEPAAAQALGAVAGMDIQRYPHTDLLPRIWTLRHNATIYDAAYLVLAEVLAAPLVTCDSALVNVPGCRAEVVCV
jgi:predicted nucleic acid-binding protein